MPVLVIVGVDKATFVQLDLLCFAEAQVPRRIGIFSVSGGGGGATEKCLKIIPRTKKWSKINLQTIPVPFFLLNNTFELRG